MGQGDRYREEGKTDWDNFDAKRDLVSGQGRQRGGTRKGEGRKKLSQGTPLGHLEGEVSADEWWRPTGGGAFQVDGCSATRKYWGEGGGENRDKAAFMGEIWGGNRR